MTLRPGGQLPPQARRRVLRAALLRPWALLVLAVGIFFFATTLTWWALPLTLATYAALVALALRDPIFRIQVLEGREKARTVARTRARMAIGLTPQARARRLPRGDNRDRIEATLEPRERVPVAIEGSDEWTRNLFSGTDPELDRTAELLVDLAEAREHPTGDQNPDTSEAIDAELSGGPEIFQTFRAQVVRASIEGDDDARARAGRFEESLDELNRRLEELKTNT